MVVEPAVAVPEFLAVALIVIESPELTVLGLTETLSTVQSGAVVGGGITTATPEPEQLLEVLDSPLTASTQAPT